MKSTSVYFSELFTNQLSVSLDQSNPIILSNISNELSKCLITRAIIQLTSFLPCGGVLRAYYQDGNNEILLDQKNLGVFGCSLLLLLKAKKNWLRNINL